MANQKMGSGEVVVVRGSLIVFRRRCGKPACRCVQGKSHETPALSYSLNGSTCILTLREEDVEEVTAALARYKKARNLLGTKKIGEML